jgi:hypothetical protein
MAILLIAGILAYARFFFFPDFGKVAKPYWNPTKYLLSSTKFIKYCIFIFTVYLYESRPPDYLSFHSEVEYYA